MEYDRLADWLMEVGGPIIREIPKDKHPKKQQPELWRRRKRG